MVQLPLHSVNAMRRCFGLNPIIVKGGTHTYNMIKDEQLPKKCHEEQYRCSNLLKPHRPTVKIKEETYAKEQGIQAPPEHTHKNRKEKKNKKSRFGVRVKGSRNMGPRAMNKVSYLGTVCVGKRLVGREGLFLGSSLGPSSP